MRSHVLHLILLEDPEYAQKIDLPAILQRWR